MDFFKKLKRKFRVRVAALIENSNGEFLLIKQTKKKREYWLLPGGGIEFGETAEQALQRELQEELNLSIDRAHFLLLNESIDPDGERHLLQIVFRVEIETVEALKVQEKVVKDVHFFSIDQILDLELRPDIKDFFEDLQKPGQSNIHFITSKWIEG